MGGCALRDHLLNHRGDLCCVHVCSFITCFGSVTVCSLVKPPNLSKPSPSQVTGARFGVVFSPPLKKRAPPRSLAPLDAATPPRTTAAVPPCCCHPPPPHYYCCCVVCYTMYVCERFFFFFLKVYVCGAGLVSVHGAGSAEDQKPSGDSRTGLLDRPPG